MKQTTLRMGQPHKDLAKERPGYLTWQGLAQYSSCSKRWLQSHVPHSLRFRVGGKVLIKAQDFDGWMERHRLDLHQLADEILGERESRRH